MYFDYVIVLYLELIICVNPLKKERKNDDDDDDGDDDDTLLVYKAVSRILIFVNKPSLHNS